MTEGHESDFLVTVRAQVMTRDESTEGWLPLAGGGLANVSIRKRARLSPGAAGHEYIIYGQRISDQSVILSCVINRDLKYFKVMPTFHHWRAGKQRNGLTFQTAADARAFDKGVVRAYNELIDGLAKSNPSIVFPPLTKYDSVGEDDVFMTLDLPVESDGIPQQQQQQQQQQNLSPANSEKSQKSVTGDRGERHRDSIRLKNQNDNHDKQAPIHYISSDKSTIQPHPVTSSPPPPSAVPPALSTTVTIPCSSVIEQTVPTIAASENYSYVTLTAVHDYNYPVADQPAAAQVLNARRESISALKKRNALEAAAQALVATQMQQSSPISTCDGVTIGIGSILKDPTATVAPTDIIKKSLPLQMRCRYCHEFYNDEWNRKGACEYAPDCFRSGFECVSGMGCARCMLYHCMSDAEGETAAHPCECVNEAGCTKRWIGLTLLSLVVPCLWCYPPLRACHWIGVNCGICGGKHKPQV